MDRDERQQTPDRWSAHSIDALRHLPAFRQKYPDLEERERELQRIEQQRAEVSP